MEHQGPVYADLHHSTNPPAPPLPVEPVQYATIKKQTDNIETTQTKDKVSPIVMLCAHSVFTHSHVQGLHYAQVQHSTNPPAPPIPVEPVQYATVKKSEPAQSETSPLDVSLSTKTA